MECHLSSWKLLQLGMVPTINRHKTSTPYSQIRCRQRLNFRIPFRVHRHATHNEQSTDSTPAVQRPAASATAVPAGVFPGVSCDAYWCIFIVLFTGVFIRIFYFASLSTKCAIWGYRRTVHILCFAHFVRELMWFYISVVKTTDFQPSYFFSVRVWRRYAPQDGEF